VDYDAIVVGSGFGGTVAAATSSAPTSACRGHPLRRGSPRRGWSVGSVSLVPRGFNFAGLDAPQNTSGHGASPCSSAIDLPSVGGANEHVRLWLAALATHRHSSQGCSACRPRRRSCEWIPEGLVGRSRLARRLLLSPARVRRTRLYRHRPWHAHGARQRHPRAARPARRARAEARDRSPGKLTERSRTFYRRR
jgi:hypothetical protein